MTDLGWIGVSLLIVCVVMIGVEGAIVAAWTWRLAKRGRLLSERLATERVLIQSERDQLLAHLEVTALLWQPYALVLRWLNHPLAIALLQSFARRWAAAR